MAERPKRITTVDRLVPTSSMVTCKNAAGRGFQNHDSRQSHGLWMPDPFPDFRQVELLVGLHAESCRQPWLPGTSLLETAAASHQQLLHRNLAGPHHGSFGRATLRSSNGAPEGRRTLCCGHQQRHTHVVSLVRLPATPDLCITASQRMSGRSSSPAAPGRRIEARSRVARLPIGTCRGHHDAMVSEVHSRDQNKHWTNHDRSSHLP